MLESVESESAVTHSEKRCRGDLFQKGHEAVVRLLVEHGFNCDVKGTEFRVALQRASRQGNEAIIRFLLKYDVGPIRRVAISGTILY